MRALFISKNLIGDGLYISEALRTWIKPHIGWEIFMQTLPDHIAPLYQRMVDDLVDMEVVFEKPPLDFDFEHTFDVSKAFQLSDKKRQHISQSYADLLGVTITEPGPMYILPVWGSPEEASYIRERHNSILVSMFSASCRSREGPNAIPTKMPPWERWKDMLTLLRDEFPDKRILMLGAPTDYLPDDMFVFCKNLGMERMHGIPLSRLAWIMKGATALLTLDNGMAHLAASQQCPTMLMYPRCLAPYYILPVGNKQLYWLHMDPARVRSDQLLAWLKWSITKIKTLCKSQNNV